MTLHYAIGQIIGDRDTQEDYCAIESGNGRIIESNTEGCQRGSSRQDVTAVLCDGMGGHSAGEIAARTAAVRFLRATRGRLTNAPSVSEALVSACHQANYTIAQEISRNDRLSGMGTTIVAVHCTPRYISWVSVGDSYLLLFRNRQLLRLNQDHSMRPVFEQMVLKGIMSREEAVSHPERNALRSALTGDELGIIDSGLDKLMLRPRDIVVMASDGIDVLTAKVLRDILSMRFRPLSKLAMKIVMAAKRVGGEGQDNTSVVLIRIP